MSMSSPFRVVIPVRLNSTRLPGKPLLDINGSPMIEHVYRRAVESGAMSVIIATDSLEIKSVAEDFGATVCMTSSDHPSGTDRLAEVVVAMDYDDDDIVVNLQGDEPLLPPQVIRQVAEDMDRHAAAISTVYEKITDIDLLLNPNVVKVVLNKRGFGIYFSRAPIPWEPGITQTDHFDLKGPHYRHVGLYAYRAGFLAEYLAWEPSPLDQIESLEQLRVLWQGQRIHCVEASESVPGGVDTPEDLERVRAYLAEQLT